MPSDVFAPIYFLNVLTNMKKAFAVLIMASLLILASPKVTLAAWWNPFGWFREKPAAQVTPTPQKNLSSEGINKPIDVQSQTKIQPGNTPKESAIKPKTSGTKSTTKETSIKTEKKIAPTESENQAQQSPGFLCNGVLYDASQCGPGGYVACLASGAQCVDPQIGAVCNGKYVSNKCVRGNFYCPFSGDAFCAVDEVNTQERQQVKNDNQKILDEMQKTYAAKSQFVEFCGNVDQQLRNEIQASGGMANDAQIQTLAYQRKQKLGCYNGTIPTAECNDLTPSYSTTRSGTCSDHGGVMIWF